MTDRQKRKGFWSQKGWGGFWIAIWIGTAGGGGVFGLLMGIFEAFSRHASVFVGLLEALLYGVIGIFCAGLAGLIVIPSFALMILLFNLADVKYLMGMAAGASVAIVSTLYLGRADVSLAELALPVFLGSLGAGIASLVYKIRNAEHQKEDEKAQGQFSLRSMHVGIAVSIILLGAWRWLALFLAP